MQTKPKTLCNIIVTVTMVILSMKTFLITLVSIQTLMTQLNITQERQIAKLTEESRVNNKIIEVNNLDASGGYAPPSKPKMLMSAFFF